MSVPAELVIEVAARAGNRCEYCRMHQALQGATFHIEHIRPQSLGGSDDLDNLAWACPSCNLLKGSRVGVVDERSGRLVPLFNPRNQRWKENFTWRGRELIGLTETWIATAELLQLNSPRRLLIRDAEAGFGLFPPD